MTRSASWAVRSGRSYAPSPGSSAGRPRRPSSHPHRAGLRRRGSTWSPRPIPTGSPAPSGPTGPGRRTRSPRAAPVEADARAPPGPHRATSPLRRRSCGPTRSRRSPGQRRRGVPSAGALPTRPLSRNPTELTTDEPWTPSDGRDAWSPSTPRSSTYRTNRLDAYGDLTPPRRPHPTPGHSGRRRPRTRRTGRPPTGRWTGSLSPPPTWRHPSRLRRVRTGRTSCDPCRSSPCRTRRRSSLYGRSLRLAVPRARCRPTSRSCPGPGRRLRATSRTTQPHRPSARPPRRPAGRRCRPPQGWTRRRPRPGRVSWPSSGKPTTARTR